MSPKNSTACQISIDLRNPLVLISAYGLVHRKSPHARSIGGPLFISETKENTVSNPVKEYLASIGRKGGAAGSGASKRRSLSHYRKIGKLSAKNRAAKAASRLSSSPTK